MVLQLTNCQLQCRAECVFVVVDVKAYLEDFYDFCQTLGDSTAEVMSEALAVSLSYLHFYRTV